MTKPLLGTAVDIALHSLVLWCCTIFEPKGLIEGSLASLQSLGHSSLPTRAAKWLNFQIETYASYAASFSSSGPGPNLPHLALLLPGTALIRGHSVPGWTLNSEHPSFYCCSGKVGIRGGVSPGKVTVEKDHLGLNPVFCDHYTHLVQFLYKDEEWEFEKSIQNILKYFFICCSLCYETYSKKAFYRRVWKIPCNCFFLRRNLF